MFSVKFSLSEVCMILFVGASQLVVKQGLSTVSGKVIEEFEVVKGSSNVAVNTIVLLA